MTSYRAIQGRGGAPRGSRLRSMAGPLFVKQPYYRGSKATPNNYCVRLGVLGGLGEMV